MIVLIFLLGSLAGTVGTLLFTAKAIARAEQETFNRCLDDAKKSFGRAWQ